MQTRTRTATPEPRFESLNAGYDATFRAQALSVGLVVPIENYANAPTPTMHEQVARIRLAESLGFSAVWLRDVPFNVPSFGDAGQMFDPFVYLGALAGQTSTIALGVASLILPLRHPAHVAKAAASVDVLSNGRLILGVASGDRPEEYPAMNQPFAERGRRFRESYDYIRRMSDHAPRHHNPFGRIDGGIDMLPKPAAGKLPLFITGSSQQSPDWIAAHANGWMTYPRPAQAQSALINDYRVRLVEAGQPNKPVMEPLYIDLVADPHAPPEPIHLGLRLGAHALRDYLTQRESIGVNHVALNLRFNRADIEHTLATLAEQILPAFH